MYTPKQFEAPDEAALYALMERFSFAPLITTGPDGPLVTHLPFLIERGEDGEGRLIGHMARANGQWRGFTGQAEALVIFQGPHAYISPSWYGEPLSVPTWNYTVAHAYGRPRLIEDEGRVYAILHALVDQHEAARAAPWTMDGLPDSYIQGMMRGIVAFELEIERLEGKFKLSQNRPLADQQRVIAALSASDDPLEQDVAAAMAEALVPHAGALGD